MRGLIRNNLYSMESNIILALALSAFLAVSSLFISPAATPFIIAVADFSVRCEHRRFPSGGRNLQVE